MSSTSWPSNLPSTKPQETYKPWDSNISSPTPYTPKYWETNIKERSERRFRNYKSNIEASENKKKYNDSRRPAEISSVITMSPSEIDSDILSTLNSNLIYTRDQIQTYSKFNRFGYFNVYDKLTQTKEYLFFTKPDCHIVKPGTMQLQDKLKADPFFIDLANRYPHVIQQLQRSAGSIPGQNSAYARSPFMNILSNCVKNTLDLPSLTASEMEGPNNMYGTHINYRKDAWTGDENIEFSLEFEDSKYAEVYMLTKAYEQYERYKTIGIIYPPPIGISGSVGDDGHAYSNYIRRKELHDTMGIYRFIVDETYEDIIHYDYVCGAYINSVPRDAFNDLKQGDGLSFSVDFKAFCVLDSDPLILYNFNKIVNDKFGSSKLKRKYVYNEVKHKGSPKRAMINGQWVTFAKVLKAYVNNGTNSNGTVYRTAVPDGMDYIYRLAWY